MEIQKMDILEMTRKDFESLQHRGRNEDIGKFDCLVILPSRGIHDSGYRLLDFVACNNNHPICRMSGRSDVIHFNGIGGFGYKWFEKYGTCPETIEPIAWNIDCLPKSGLLRIFTYDKLVAGASLSSFEIYGIKTAV